MFIALDRVSKFTCIEFHERAGEMGDAAFPRNVVPALSCKIHKVPTDNDMAFADLPKNREGPTRRFLVPYMFDLVRVWRGIEHRPTKSHHPRVHGQAGWKTRTVKEAT